jgi:hypothetical protein
LTAGGGTLHVSVDEAAQLIEALQQFLADHAPWRRYALRTARYDGLFTCCRCGETTARPGVARWSFRPIPAAARAHTPRAPRAESICGPCLEGSRRA